MIHVSLDSSEDSAATWAADAGFPWLTVLPDDVERSDLKTYHTSGSVPFYTMIDASGEVLATGSLAIFKRVGELK